MTMHNVLHNSSKVLQIALIVLVLLVLATPVLAQDEPFITNTPVVDITPETPVLPELPNVPSLDRSDLVIIAVLFILLVAVGIFSRVLLEALKQVGRSFPPEVVSIIRAGLEEADKRIDEAVGKTPNTIDDELWKQLEPRIRELLRVESQKVS